MEIRAWRYAVTLAEELHFGRAARRHFLAEAHFGRQIRRLENELGERLFDRTSRRVTLTPAGSRLIAEAVPVIAAFDALAGVTAPADDTPEVVRLGVLGFGLADRWEDFHDELRRRRPGLRLRFVELDMTDQYRALQGGRVDVAVIQHLGPVDGVRIDPVLSVPRVVAIPAESRWASAGLLEEADLRADDWLPTVGLESWVGRSAGVGRGPAVRSPAAIPAAVAATGLACVHAEPAARYFPHPAVSYRPVAGRPCEVAVATREDDERPVITAFRASARAAAVPAAE